MQEDEIPGGVRGSDPGGGEIFRTCPDRPWGPPSLLYNRYRVFPGVKSGRGVTLAPHPLLVPWSRKSTATPLLPLWAVRPVQSLSACTRVHFTLLTAYLPNVTSCFLFLNITWPHYLPVLVTGCLLTATLGRSVDKCQ